jgi:hypothetical protein
MTRDKILELARTAGGYDGFTSAPSDWDSGDFVISPEEIERFAALVAAAEREACAKVCDDNHWEDHRLFADAIRARGQK